MATGRDGNEASDHWATPDWLYNQLNDEFKFDFDPCPLNAKFDGLSVEWGGANYINPPYNRKDKPRFIRRAFQEWRNGKTCVLLIPAAMDIEEMHEIIFPFASEIRIPKGRIAFKGFNTKGVYSEKNKGKHASMIVIFRASDTGTGRWGSFTRPGRCPFIPMEQVKNGK